MHADAEDGVNRISSFASDNGDLLRPSGRGRSRRHKDDSDGDGDGSFGFTRTISSMASDGDHRPIRSNNRRASAADIIYAQHEMEALDDVNRKLQNELREFESRVEALEASHGRRRLSTAEEDTKKSAKNLKSVFTTAKVLGRYGANMRTDTEKDNLIAREDSMVNNVFGQQEDGPENYIGEQFKDVVKKAVRNHNAKKDSELEEMKEELNEARDYIDEVYYSFVEAEEVVEDTYKQMSLLESQTELLYVEVEDARIGKDEESSVGEALQSELKELQDQLAARKQSLVSHVSSMGARRSDGATAVGRTFSGSNTPGSASEGLMSRMASQRPAGLTAMKSMKSTKSIKPFGAEKSMTSAKSFGAQKSVLPIRPALGTYAFGGNREALKKAEHERDNEIFDAECARQEAQDEMRQLEKLEALVSAQNKLGQWDQALALKHARGQMEETESELSEEAERLRGEHAAVVADAKRAREEAMARKNEVDRLKDFLAKSATSQHDRETLLKEALAARSEVLARQSEVDELKQLHGEAQQRAAVLQSHKNIDVAQQAEIARLQEISAHFRPNGLQKGQNMDGNLLDGTLKRVLELREALSKQTAQQQISQAELSEARQRLEFDESEVASFADRYHAELENAAGSTGNPNQDMRTELSQIRLRLLAEEGLAINAAKEVDALDIEASAQKAACEKELEKANKLTEELRQVAQAKGKILEEFKEQTERSRRETVVANMNQEIALEAKSEANHLSVELAEMRAHVEELQEHLADDDSSQSGIEDLNEPDHPPTLQELHWTSRKTLSSSNRVRARRKAREGNKPVEFDVMRPGLALARIKFLKAEIAKLEKQMGDTEPTKKSSAVPVSSSPSGWDELQGKLAWARSKALESIDDVVIGVGNELDSTAASSSMQKGQSVRPKKSRSSAGGEGDAFVRGATDRNLGHNKRLDGGGGKPETDDNVDKSASMFAPESVFGAVFGFFGGDDKKEEHHEVAPLQASAHTKVLKNRLQKRQTHAPRRLAGVAEEDASVHNETND